MRRTARGPDQAEDRRSAARRVARPRRPRSRLLELVLLALVVGVGVFLRVFRLDTIPTGLRYDEAYDGMDALRIVDGERPVFLTGNFGREVLFIYLQAVSVSLLGQSDLALRVVAAGFGIATLLASFILVRRLFSFRIALLTVAWLSVSLWHVIFSRIGLRTISLPFFGVATFYCLWRGLERAAAAGARATESDRPDLRLLVWFGASGVLLGLSLYTYTAARLLPFVVVAFAVYLVWCHRQVWRRARTGFLLALGLAVLVAVPEGIFFLRHPDAFVTRASQISVFNPDVNGGHPLRALGYAAYHTLGMLNVAGDANWDRNIPGRPVFDPASSLVFLVGLGRVVRHVRQPAFALVVLWLALLLGPGFFAARDAPNFLHFTGIIPAVFVVPAVGAAWLWEWWEQRAPARLTLAPVGAVGLAFLVGAILTYRAYFGIWGRSPEVAFLFNSDRWLALRLARDLAAAGQAPLFVAAGEPDEPLGTYALRSRPEAPAIRTFDGERTIPFAAAGIRPTYLYPASGRPPSFLRERYWLGPTETVVGRTPAGEPVLALQVAAPRFAPERLVPARFGEALEIEGFDLPHDVRSGEALTVHWYWRVLQPDSRDLTFFNQLYDASGVRQGQSDRRILPPAYWATGTSGISSFEVPVAADAPTGPATLLVGVYDRRTMSRLPVIDGAGRLAGSQITLGPIKIHGRSEPAPRVPIPWPAWFDDQIDFLGYAISPPHLESGTSFAVTAYWSARSRPPRDDTVFVHLLDDQGKLVAQNDSPPRGGSYPTSLWDVGEVIVDTHAITLGTALPGGIYELEIGLYHPETGERVAVLDDDGQPRADHLLLPIPGPNR